VKQSLHPSERVQAVYTINELAASDLEGRTIQTGSCGTMWGAAGGAAAGPEASNGVHGHHHHHNEAGKIPVTGACCWLAGFGGDESSSAAWRSRCFFVLHAGLRPTLHLTPSSPDTSLYACIYAMQTIYTTTVEVALQVTSTANPVDVQQRIAHLLGGNLQYADGPIDIGQHADPFLAAHVESVRLADTGVLGCRRRLAGLVCGSGSGLLNECAEAAFTHLLQILSWHASTEAPSCVGSTCRASTCTS